jgi:hypothetical protein
VIRDVEVDRVSAFMTGDAVGEHMVELAERNRGRKGAGAYPRLHAGDERGQPAGHIEVAGDHQRARPVAKLMVELTQLTDVPAGDE